MGQFHLFNDNSLIRVAVIVNFRPHFTEGSSLNSKSVFPCRINDGLDLLPKKPLPTFSQLFFTQSIFDIYLPLAHPLSFASPPSLAPSSSPSTSSTCPSLPLHLHFNPLILHHRHLPTPTAPDLPFSTHLDTTS